ncbi:MAG: hypothetical protein WCC64_12445, partial [Aliidongia sp.]
MTHYTDSNDQPLVVIDEFLAASKACIDTLKPNGGILVRRVVHNAGYNLFNFTRASSVLKRQSALACLLLRSRSQAST